MPAWSTRGVISTNTNAENSAGCPARAALRHQGRYAAERGSRDGWAQSISRRQLVGERAGVGRIIGKSVGPAIDPIRVPVPALVDCVGGHAGAGDCLRGALPGMPGLSAAVQQQHRVTAIA